LSKSFRLLKKIKDPKFEIDRLEFYSLSLFIGNRDFQVMVTDSESRQILLLEDFVLDPTLNDEIKFDVLQFIFDDHHLLLANFWKTISVVIKNRSFTFVPYALYEEESIGNYLNYNASLDPNSEDVMLTYHKHLDMVNVFAFPVKLRELVTAIYPGRKIIFQHQSSCLINGTFLNNAPEMRDFTIYIDRFGLHILVMDDKKLLFYNQYIIHQFGEYQKYMRMAAASFNFDFEKDTVNLYGYLGKNTPHFAEFKKFLPHLSLGGRPNNLNFSYIFDELLDHQYFDMYSSELLRN